MICLPCHMAINPPPTFSGAHHTSVNPEFKNLGRDLVEDTTNILVRRIIKSIIEVVLHSEEPLVHNLSVHLSTRLKHNYVYMSNLFSEKLGITIEKFYICHKIERVKELLIYGKLNLTEIAFKLHYSSPAHLSNQFKKITGLTPSRFRQLNDRKCSWPENRKDFPVVFSKL